MDTSELYYYYNKFKFGEDNFHSLMAQRVRRILLVANFYDAYILEQDQSIMEQISSAYHLLNLSSVPKIKSVPTGEQALQELQWGDFDLVITMMRTGNITPFDLADRIRETHPQLPVLLLLNSIADIAQVRRNPDGLRAIHDVFMWNGDSQLFVAMLKYVEDQMNVDFDTKYGFVRTVLLVEDDIHYASRFLPLLYSEVMKQTRRLISEELNDTQRNLRMRGRPKVLMAHTYEEALDLMERYSDELLCIITDARYSREGEIDGEAGVRLIRTLRERYGDVPALLQSSEPENELRAKEVRASFLHKHSPHLSHGVKDFVLNNLGFGDFVFRTPGGMEIERAHSMAEFEKKLKIVPSDCLRYHADNNHFSTWLTAHGEFQLARRIRPMTAEDLEGERDLRAWLVRFFHEYRSQHNRGKIVSFDRQSLHVSGEVVRLAPGSLGGKGRGLAFLNALVATMDLEHRYDGLRIRVPKTAIIGTDEYSEFIEENHLSFLGGNPSDDSIKAAFLAGQLSRGLQERLVDLLEELRYPLAVRSSSLLEDSQSQPFAGVYGTFMLPNNHPAPTVRLAQLSDAIKLVFASTFFDSAKRYFDNIDYELDEEKMAVVIQQVAGGIHEHYYYPHFSGVANSYDYYPAPYQEHSDGTVSLAIGMGKYVVEGSECFRFCPRYPTRSTHLSDEIPKSAQRDFFAIDLHNSHCDLRSNEDVTLRQLDMKTAERHGVLTRMVSTFDVQNHRIVDGCSVRGPRLLTFAPILKYDDIPLAKVLEDMLRIGEVAMGVPVEVEFAVTLDHDAKRDVEPTLYLLQIRPLTAIHDTVKIDVDGLDRSELFLLAEGSLGNGVVDDLVDIVWVHPDRFDNTKTLEMQSEIARLNDRMRKNDVDFVLIGPGRWGTRDRFLGIPVRWDEVSRAKVIVETGLPGFPVEASQGAHFFHNLVALNVGYFTVPHLDRSSFLDAEWLDAQNVVEEGKWLRHIRLPRPLVIEMDGTQGVAIIRKPA